MHITFSIQLADSVRWTSVCHKQCTGSPRISVNCTKTWMLTDVNSIPILSSSAQKVKTPTQVQGPWGTCLDIDGNILVAGYNDHQVHKFTPNREHPQSVGKQSPNLLQFNSPVGVFYNNMNQKIYVSEFSKHRIQVLNDDLTFSTTFGSQGHRNDEILNPCGMAADSTGNVYVTNFGNNCIQVFTEDDKYIRAIGAQGMLALALDSFVALETCT